jgi:t-SNARE complex subunit (syntaxin)
MTEFEPFEISQENRLYQRIGVLESELTSARQQIENLERVLDTSDARTDKLIRLLICTLIVIVLMAIFMAIVGIYLVFMR